MPVEEKVSSVTLDEYVLTIVDRSSIEVAQISSLPGIGASFRFNAGAYEMIILSDVKLEQGVAIVDYSAALDKISVFHIYDEDGAVIEVVELGEFLNKRVLSDMHSKISETLINKENPHAYVVDSYETEDGDKLTKLLPTDQKINIFKK